MRRLPLLAVLMVVLTAPAADAVTVRVETHGTDGRGVFSVDHRLWIEAAPGEANRISVSFEKAGGWRVRDDGGPVSAGPGCTSDGSTATCLPQAPAGLERSTPTYSARVELGDGDDSVEWGPWHDDVEITGGDGADELAVTAAAGRVRLAGGAGPDTFRSDNPRTALDYSAHPQGVNVSANGVADDGAPGEGDDVRGRYGELYGSRFGDRLAAGSDGALINGGDGDDVLEGGPGNDAIGPGRGEDRAYGGGGNDTLTVHPDAAGGELSGGPGNDSLHMQDEDPRFGLPPASSFTLDGLANDGTQGGRLNVQADFETVVLGSESRLVGSDAPEALTAFRGVDGAGGDDLIYGAGTLTGGPGRDLISFVDDLSRVAIRTRDGEADVLNCSDGVLPSDVEVDELDTAPDCAPGVALLRQARTLRPSRGGYITVRITCPRRADIPCDGPALLRGSGAVVIARGKTGAIGPGRSRGVRIKVAARWRSALRRGRRVRATLVVRTIRAAPRAQRTTTLGKVGLRR